MDRRQELREFLQTRRARLRPEDVGLPVYGGYRRVNGLRREEVAHLAGISSDYYVRIEQGRTRQVSQDVFDSVARVLRLSNDERMHFGNLIAAGAGPSRKTLARKQVRLGLRLLLDSMDRSPAYLLGRRMDVLAMNPLARLVFEGLEPVRPGSAPERLAVPNLARFVVLAESAKTLFPDWLEVARNAAAYLRLEGGRYPEDSQLAALVGELTLKSDVFRQLWAQYPVADRGHGTKRLSHSLAGPLTLAYETLRSPDEPDQLLVCFNAEPGSSSASSLQMLANWGLPTESPQLRRPSASAENPD
jgi:transcriptional regulator with XRE-family HTH domain